MDWDQFWMGLLSQHPKVRAKQQVNSRGRQADGVDVLFTQPRVHCDNKPNRSDFIPIISWHFQMHLANFSILN